jgi:hypothetical protein
MQPSAITDFRLGLEIRLPRAEQAIQRPLTANGTWSFDIEHDTRHVHVSWCPVAGFLVGRHGVHERNVDQALKATVSELMKPSLLAA